MPLFWFLAGALTTLAALIVVRPWLRGMPRPAPRSALPWRAGAGVIALLALVFGLYRWIGRPELAAPGIAAGPSPAALGAAVSPGPAAQTPADPAVQSKAGSMSSAIAGLSARLAKGGGTPADWELLAKSYEFEGQPDAAGMARAHRLPPVPTDGGFAAAQAMSAAMSAQSSTSAQASTPGAGATDGAALVGEVSIAEALKAKATAGATLFIVAKSVDRPGAPVAVFRGSVADWPVKFRLDDSLSMMPGRNLSTAGRVTVEARISKSGQAMPAPGDLMGSTGAIDPSQHPALKILIDHVIS